MNPNELDIIHAENATDKLNEFLNKERTTTEIAKIGKLQSTISGTIHTKQAAQLIQGAVIKNNKPEPGGKKFKAIGLYNFSVKCAILESAIKKDDPYADAAFYHIHEEVIRERAELKERIVAFKNWLSGEIPKTLSLTAAMNLTPLTLEFKFNSTMAFQLLYLILELDEYFRLIKLAQHISLVDPTQSNKQIHDGMRIARNIMNNVNFYKHTDVTRKDVMESNQRAKQAQEAMPMLVLDEGFITGATRSSLAPSIATRPESDSPVTDDKKTKVA
jgi:integrating conjugative element protein (TIGR03761 family)